MKIKVLGMGCPSCKALEKSVAKALDELHITAHVEKIEDVQEIMSYGIMSVPALVVNDTVVSVGRVLDVLEIKKLLEGKKISPSDQAEAGNCTCNGK